MILFSPVFPMILRISIFYVNITELYGWQQT